MPIVRRLVVRQLLWWRHRRTSTRVGVRLGDERAGALGRACDWTAGARCGAMAVEVNVELSRSTLRLRDRLVHACLAAALAACQAPPSASPNDSRTIEPLRRIPDVAPTLHQRLPPPEALARRTDQPVGDGDGLPTAIWSSAGEIAAPDAPAAGAALPTYAARPPPRIGLDLRTQGDAALHYQMVFNPSIAPFKRELALDTVHEDLTLTASGEGRAVLPPRAAARPGHELFWGHVRLELVAGQAVGLPSVAPSSQILAWAADPPLPLQLDRDGAGNFRVVPSATGAVSFRYLMDAPADYFAAPLGRGVVAGGPPPPQLPRAVAQRVRPLWPRLGLRPGDDRIEQLNKLVAWFRSFAAGDPQRDGRDPLADLILGQRGVCRHRTLGFVIVAQSLGIPAHYVTNDAHAFAEVWVRRADGSEGWMRVDLGGASQSLELHAADGKRLHQPQYPDPFPQPPEYAGQAAAQPSGAPQQPHAWGGAAELVGADRLEQAAPAAALPPTGGAAGVAAGGDGALSRTQWLMARASEASPSAAAPAEDRLPTTLTLAPPPPSAWIGETVSLEGQLQGGEGVVLPIELWLIDPLEPTQGLLLGTVATAADGHFVAQLAVPSDALPRAYDVVARFAGDLKRAPSDSGL